MRVLIIGCGYVGIPLGRRLAGHGHEVFGLRRTATAEMRDAGIQPLVGDITDARTLKSLPNQFDWVVNTVAAGGGAAEYRRVYVEGMRNVLEWLAASPPERFVYTSSTSVYGQDDGSEVEERSETAPVAETSQMLLAAEDLLREQRSAGMLPATVLRCAGIYGPERGYWLRQFLTGEAALEGTGERWLNMVHRDDVGGAIIAVLQAAEPGAVYNVSDDEPTRQRTVFEWLSARLNRPMPAAVAAEGIARRRGATNKRVLNRKLKLELEWKLQYPTFREGYEAELARLGRV